MKPKIKKKFKREFRRQLRLAIAAAIGFLIAYSWRDFVVDLSKNFITGFSKLTSIHLVNFSSAIFVTFIGVILILIASKMLE